MLCAILRRGTTMPRVRLTQKFATFIAGVDLRHFKAGASVNVTPSQARELINGGWATAGNEKNTSDTGTKKKLKTKRLRGTRKPSG